MYKAIELENGFRERLHSQAKAFLMAIIDRRIDLGWEEPSDDGFYTLDTADFKEETPRIMVWAANTYDNERNQESRIVTEVHLEDEIYLTCKADPEFSDDDKHEEEFYLRTLPLDQMVNFICVLEDYADEINAELL